MTAHKRRMNETELEIDWNWLSVSQREHLPQVYDVKFPKGTMKGPYAFNGCLGSSWTWNGLHNNFNWQNRGYIIRVL